MVARVRVFGERRTFSGAPVFSALTGLCLGAVGSGEGTALHELLELVQHLTTRTVHPRELLDFRAFGRIREEVLRQHPKLHRIHVRPELEPDAAAVFLAELVREYGDSFECEAVGLMLYTLAPVRQYVREPGQRVSE